MTKFSITFIVDEESERNKYVSGYKYKNFGDAYRHGEQFEGRDVYLEFDSGDCVWAKVLDVRSLAS